MGAQEEAYQQSMERLTSAHQNLADLVGMPRLAWELDRSIETEDISELNHEAYRIEGVSEEMPRFLKAQEGYNAALGVPFDERDKLEAVHSALDKTPNGLAEAAYDLEQITPEISRYLLAHQLKFEEEGRAFGELDRRATIEVMPGTPDGVAFAAKQIEKKLSPETLERADDRLTREAVKSYKSDYAQANDKTWEEAKDIEVHGKFAEATDHDVVNDGGIIVQGIELVAAFQNAKEHTGEQSLETLKNNAEPSLEVPEMLASLPTLQG